MNKKLKYTNSLNIKDKKYVWHPYTQMKLWNSQQNNIITKGNNFSLVTDDNRKIIDGIASMWCNVWGYGKNPVISAMINQLKFLPNSTLFGLGNKTSIDLAETLIKLTKGLDKVFYSDNGSTAIEVALKMSLQYWKNKGKIEKNKFVSLNHGYHGDTIAAMSIGYVPDFFDAYRTILFNPLKIKSPNEFENESGSDKEIMEKSLENAEQILKENSKELSAMIMESGAQIAGGLSIYPRGFQKRISELCKKYDILLILDEIATGFGRLGNLIEYAAQGSIPDIVCYGKALNGGYFPIAVTVTTNEVYNQFLGKYLDNKQFFHGHTYTGHPVGCAACVANIELYKKTNLIKQIRENASYIKTRFPEIRKSKIVHKIRHKGLLLGVELIDNNKKPLNLIENKSLNHFVIRESIKRGVYLRGLDNIITVIPPLAIPRKELKKILDVQIDVLNSIEEKINVK
ncbi:MAG: adenosylmethionine--8-amino-7-oxononanoate transaminase [Nitrososphaeraceae archaeon]